MTIASTQNSKIKKLRALSSKKGRADFCEYLIEGVNILKDLPRPEEIIELYIKKSSYEKLAFLEEKLGKEAYIVEDFVFDSISGTKNPNGVIATAKPRLEEQTKGDVVVLLDGISDSGNLGTIIRSASAKGIDTILLYGNCADVYSPKTVRASMGGLFYVNIKKVQDSDIHKLIGEGYELMGLDMSGKSVYDYNKDKKIILAVGNEAHGLSDSIKNMAQGFLSIPIKNVESLNAAISLSIALYIV